MIVLQPVLRYISLYAARPVEKLWTHGDDIWTAFQTAVQEDPWLVATNLSWLFGDSCILVWVKVGSFSDIFGATPTKNGGCGRLTSFLRFWCECASLRHESALLMTRSALNLSLREDGYLKSKVVCSARSITRTSHHKSRVGRLDSLLLLRVKYTKEKW